MFEKSGISHERINDDHHGITIAGHRGGMVGYEPENTIRAFERAIDQGLQVIELDVSYFKIN